MRPKRKRLRLTDRVKALREKLKQLCRETAHSLAARINWQNKYVAVVVYPWFSQVRLFADTFDGSQLRVTISFPMFDVRTVLIDPADPKLFECVIVRYQKRGSLEPIEHWLKLTTPKGLTDMIVNHILSLQKDVVVETKVPDQKPLRKIKATEI